VVNPEGARRGLLVIVLLWAVIGVTACAFLGKGLSFETSTEGSKSSTSVKIDEVDGKVEPSPLLKAVKP
jgi:hypothetical protein